MQIHLGDILTKFFVLYENFIRYYWRTCEPTSNLYLWYKTAFGDAYYHLTIPCFNLTTEEDLVTGESEDYYNDHYDYYGDYDYTFDVNEFCTSYLKNSAKLLNILQNYDIFRKIC